MTDEELFVTLSDRERGYICGYPECCIEFFVTHYMPAIRTPWTRAYVQTLHPWYGYVPCPACRAA